MYSRGDVWGIRRHGKILGGEGREGLSGAWCGDWGCGDKCSGGGCKDRSQDKKKAVHVEMTG